MLLFMDIQIHRLRTVADADLRADAFIRPVRFPLLEQIPAANVGQMIHFQKTDLVGNFAVGDLIDPVAADLPGCRPWTQPRDQTTQDPSRCGSDPSGTRRKNCRLPG